MTGVVQATYVTSDVQATYVTSVFQATQVEGVASPRLQEPMVPRAVQVTQTSFTRREPRIKLLEGLIFGSYK